METPQAHIFAAPNETQADVWQEITSEFGFFFCRNGNKVATRAKPSELAVCWGMLKERFATLHGELPES